MWYAHQNCCLCMKKSVRRDLNVKSMIFLSDSSFGAFLSGKNMLYCYGVLPDFITFRIFG